MYKLIDKMDLDWLLYVKIGADTVLLQRRQNVSKAYAVLNSDTNYVEKVGGKPVYPIAFKSDIIQRCYCAHRLRAYIEYCHEEIAHQTLICAYIDKRIAVPPPVTYKCDSDAIFNEYIKIAVIDDLSNRYLLDGVGGRDYFAD